MYLKNSMPLGFRWITKWIETIKLYNRSFYCCCSLCFYISMVSASSSKKSLLRYSWNYVPPILVRSSAKHIATQILVIAKLNEREDFILRSFVCDIIRPYKELPVQKLATEAEEKVWKLFKVKNEDTRTMSMASF